MAIRAKKIYKDGFSCDVELSDDPSEEELRSAFDKPKDLTYAGTVGKYEIYSSGIEESEFLIVGRSPFIDDNIKKRQTCDLLLDKERTERLYDSVVYLIRS